MSNRELVLQAMGRLPEDAPFSEFRRELELVEGVQAARVQIARGEGRPLLEVRDELRKRWASR